MTMEDKITVAIIGAAALVCSTGVGITAWGMADRVIADKAKATSSNNTKIENVIGSESPEKFYELNGQRVYLEIDGKSVEEYVKGVK